MAEPHSALNVQSITVRLGGLTILDGVSLATATGQRHAIIGPNGAGKTTLFNVIAGLRRPDSGTIWLEADNITSYSPHSRRRLGLSKSFQRSELFESLSVEDNLRLAALGTQPFGWVTGHLPDTLEGHVAAALELAGLGDLRKRLIRELPHGLRRLVDIAVAVTGPSRVLLLDEPSSGIGHGELDRIVSLFSNLRGDLAILFVEHNMNLVRQVADKVTVLHHGSVLFEGSAGDAARNELVYAAYVRKD